MIFSSVDLVHLCSATYHVSSAGAVDRRHAHTAARREVSEQRRMRRGRQVDGGGEQGGLHRGAEGLFPLPGQPVASQAVLMGPPGYVYLLTLPWGQLEVGQGRHRCCRNKNK